jgi:NAD(P)-dependent dehydrogenase (short-subunit alcohol dehydrogenase family)
MPRSRLTSVTRSRRGAVRPSCSTGTAGDVLVHAAAAFDSLSLAGIDAATWRRVQAVNVESPLWLSQAFTPGMAQRGFGRIVFIASDTFWDPPAPTLVPYIASKGAVVGIM